MAALAKKLEPQGEWLSESEIAKRCGIHRQTCAARLDDLGYEPDAERSNAKKKMYFFTSEMQFEIKTAKDEAAAMRVRDLRAKTELNELKLARERGEVVPIAEAVELVQSIVGKIFQELTVAQGKRIDPKLAKARTVIEVKKIRNGDNQWILKMLRANFKEFLA